MELNSLVLVKFAFSMLLLFCAINITLNNFGFSPRYSKTETINNVLSKLFVSNFRSSQEVNKTSVIERRFVLTRDEVLLTREVLIDAKPCKSGQSLAVFIYSSAQSRGKYFKKRQFLRNAWIRKLKDRNVSVYFLIGLNRDPLVNHELQSEAKQYEDIIQFGFIDHYYNLTLKSISMLRWIENSCQIPYILKTDDDVMINAKNLMNRLNEFKTGITGKLWHKSQSY